MSKLQFFYLKRLCASPSRVTSLRKNHFPSYTKNNFNFSELICEIGVSPLTVGMMNYTEHSRNMVFHSTVP